MIKNYRIKILCSLRKNESGSTLLEILIAMMILSTAGVMVIGSHFVANNVNLKSTQKNQVLNRLSQAAQEISLKPFKSCTSQDTYTSPADTNATIKVEVFDHSGEIGQWKTCDGTGQTTNAKSQLITVTVEQEGKIYSQSIMKTNS